MTLRVLATFALCLTLTACVSGGQGLLPPTASPTAPTPSVSPRPEQTKPPGIDTTQPQGPLVTSVRWAVDQRSTGRLLILLYQGYASSFEIVDASGATVMRLGIAGSGIFGQDSCVSSTRHPPTENVTWLGVDQATLDSFTQRYATYRVIANGIPAGQVTLPLIDSGCRGSS